MSSKSKKGLRKSFYNTSLGVFKNMLMYKGLKYGKNVVFVDEAYTSKACSSCGLIKKDLKLSDRVYVCSNENCKNCIDAWKNISNNPCAKNKLQYINPAHHQQDTEKEEIIFYNYF